MFQELITERLLLRPLTSSDDKVFLEMHSGTKINRFLRNPILSLTDAENLALAIEALHKGGNLPCILNAANEIAVWAFLRNRVGFLDMTDIIEKTMNHVPFIEKPTLDEYLDSDAEARNYTASLIQL